MFEIIFLFVLGLIWIIFAVVQDLRSREVANWLNFSLIIFALGFRFFYSLFYGLDSGEGFRFFYQGLFGLGIFFILGNLLYYGKMFAGGDAKLMISLGSVIPVFNDFNSNLGFFVLFFVLFLFSGAVYSIVASVGLSLKNFKIFRKELSIQFKKNKKIIYVGIFGAIVFLAMSFYESSLVFFAILFFVLPYVYIYVKAVDESCMVKKVKVKDLREGDWLYEDLKLGKKIMKSKWQGLTKEEIKVIQKDKKYILIREGIPFTPAFLISFLTLFILLKLGYGILFGNQ